MATTIVNGNLIVRGSSFFTVGDTLRYFRTENNTAFALTENNVARNYVFGYVNGESGCTAKSDVTSYAFKSPCPNLTTHLTED